MQTDKGTLPQDQGRCSIDATAGIIHATSSPEQSSHDPSAAANPALSASAQEYTEEGAQPLTGCQASTAGQGNDDQQTIDPAGVLENTTPQPTQAVVSQDTGDIGQHIPSSEPVRCPRRPARFVSPLKIGHTHPLPDSVKVVALRERILSDPARFGSVHQHLNSHTHHQRLAGHLREVLPPAKDLQSWKMYKDHHGDLGRRVVKRLSDGLYAAARTAFKRFGNQKLVRNKCPIMLKPNDCAFFVMRYMELYDGDDSPLIQAAESEEYTDLRSQMLCYMVFHSKNVAAPLPPELEELRPSSPCADSSE
uniref:Ubiquitin-like protease family profile domain-containing protein n=1 Tax=Oryza nivara TaxID=4536 RepID=A0A0E0GZL3_ORYNI